MALFRRTGFGGWWEANREAAVPVLFGTGAVVLVGIVIGLFVWSDPKSMRVASRTWACSIDVQRLRAIQEGAWKYSVPGDAYNKTCREKQDGTKRLKVGEDCETKTVIKDGKTKTKRSCSARYISVPTYSTWCDYTVNRWKHERSVISNGGGAQPVAWPEADLDEDERENGRAVTYTLYLKMVSGQGYTCHVSDALYWQLKEETLVEMEIGVVVGDARCGTLHQISEMDE
jgi:hypothetical protein